MASPPIADLIPVLRTQLGPESSRRVGMAHAAVLRTLMESSGEALPVSRIHELLVQQGSDIKLSGVYRVLEVLEEARVVECQWHHSLGRPLRVFRAIVDLPASP